MYKLQLNQNCFTSLEFTQSVSEQKLNISRLAYCMSAKRLTLTQHALNLLFPLFLSHTTVTQWETTKQHATACILAYICMYEPDRTSSFSIKLLELSRTMAFHFF